MNHTSSETSLPPAFQHFRASLAVASPGRINLIGEHTDYNKGFVLPTAIDKKIFLEFSENHTSTCNVYSHDLKEHLQFHLGVLKPSQTSWHNYILGVVAEIGKKGKVVKGFDCILSSQLPVGAGVSSSAALECGIATGLNELFQLGLTKQEIVELSMMAEHNFVGTKCGIMDQFASVMSKKDHLIFLDCRNLEAGYIPADFQSCKILLLNTNVTHQLAESEYNTRRSQCEAVVEVIQKRYPGVLSLRDVSLDLLEKFASELPETLYRRASYVIEENLRVLKAVEAMKAADLKEFGKLMYQSHQGLSQKYEVSCPELDFLVDFTRNHDYIYGSRMMGGGFGGCTINLIEEEKIQDFIPLVSHAYREKFGIALDAFSVLPDEGTSVTFK